MTQDEIIEMARQAGFEKVIDINPSTGIKTIQAYDSNSLETFAKLVAAKEREACATVCDRLLTNSNTGGGWSDATIECSVQIRARGEL